MKRNFASLALAALFCAAPAGVHAGMTVTPSPGFTVAWDGNDGDGFNAESPAPVAANLATGATAAAFTSSDLGPEIGVPFHAVTNLNDGLYGNANSWIGGNLPQGVTAPFGGVKLGGFFDLTSFAFGRDNGNGAFDDSAAGTDCCGGQLDDRCLGTYKIQITRTGNPSVATPETGDAATGWQTIATIVYQSSDDAAPGGLFTPWFRHEFEIAEGVKPISATGFRIMVPATGLATGTAVDEIEIFGTAAVDPDSDGDGFDNEVETALGFNPNSAASTPESVSGIATAVEFSFYAGKNSSYRIEASTDLQQWTTVEDNVAGTGGEIRRLYSTRGLPRRSFRAVRLP